MVFPPRPEFCGTTRGSAFIWTCVFWTLRGHSGTGAYPLHTLDPPYSELSGYPRGKPARKVYTAFAALTFAQPALGPNAPACVPRPTDRGKMCVRMTEG